MKRILSVFLAFILVLSVAMPISAESTVPKQYDDAGNILKDLGVLKGNTSGSLMLNENLSREQLVVMMSRLYGEAEKAENFQAPNTFKDLTPKNKDFNPYYFGYIKWAVDKGLISGYTDETFRPKNDTTVQEYQKILLSALGYEEAAKHWEMVPELSERYGLMKDLNLKPSAKLSRGQMSVMSLNTLAQEMNGRDITLANHLGVKIPIAFSVKANVKIDNNTLKLEGEVTGAENLFVYLKPISTDIVAENKLIPVTIDKEGKFSLEIPDLEKGDYHFRFQSGTQYTDYRAITIDVLPFALDEVGADNLKEIHLTFTQAVDKTIASLPSNYTTTAGSIKDIRFEDKDTKIVITLNNTMVQQTEYTISAMKIRSASGEEITLTNHKFSVFDNQPPEMTSYSQLGNKGLRIYFSEPIKTAASSNFKLNGKDFPGHVKLENNMVTLSYFSSLYSLSEGTHSLIIAGVEDFAGYKTIQYNHEIVITKDSTAPKIIGSSATLERVILEFDKELDPATSTIRNFYWKSGASKRYASKVTIEGTKAILDFTSNNLTTSENIIYVDNAMDYFGNKINDSTKVLPVIDTTSPEVINHSVSKDGRSITVYYSKNVVGNNRRNYTILDESNKPVNIRDIQGSGAEYTVNLYSQLPIGYNSFAIDGVVDTTALKNQVVPFSTIIEMKDIEKPRMISATGYGNNILIHFSKVMDISTLIDPYNYIMVFKGKQENLPVNSFLRPGDDGKSIEIVLPENYDGDKIFIGSANNLTELKVMRLKDSVGNPTDPLILNIPFDGTSSGNAKAVDYDNARPGRQGVLLESNLIQVRFNIPIVQASEDDFTIDGRTISSVIADGTNNVTIYLEDSDSTSIPTGSLRIIGNNKMKTSIDTGVDSSIVLIWDKVAPRIKDNTGDLNVSVNQIELPFTEALEDEASSLYRRDLEIYRLADNKLLSKDGDYSTHLKPTDKSTLIITINNRTVTSRYSVRLSGEYDQENLSYIRDKDGNPALVSDIYITDREIYK